MAAISERKLTQAVMLDQIVEVLQRGKPTNPPAYTLILGAGASYGSVPTAKQMLGIPDKNIIDPQCIPAFLHHLKNDSSVALDKLEDVVKEFWQGFIVANPDLTQPQTIDGETQTLLKMSGGFPGPESVAAAYKNIFDQRRTGGINTPAGAREYLRDVTLRTNDQIHLNGTHFFLASLLSLQRYAGSRDAERKDFFIGKRPFARTIFTTNFDPLLQVSLQLFQLLYYMTDRPDLLAADALQTDDHPALHLFYAHGSVHRPFLANTDSEIGHLRERNARDLAAYLGQHGVIVLGYSGWDDCLLKGLNQTSSFANNLYWLARGEHSLSEQVKEFLLSHPNAYWVEIRDGGEFMAALHRRLCPGMPFTELLQNPIPFMRERLERVELSNISTDSIPAKASNTITDGSVTKADKPTSPEEFRKQVVELLKESEVQFDALSKDGGTMQQLNRLEHQADLAYSKSDYTKAIELYSQIASNNNASRALRAKAFLRRGFAYGVQGRIAEAMADYTDAIELPDAPADLVALALVNRGFGYGRQNKPVEEMADCTKVIELPGAPASRVAWALVNRGICYGQQNKPAEAIADYTRAIELPGAPAELVAKALFNRGVCHRQQNKPAEAIVDYTSAIELPSAPADLVAKALFNRGVCYGQQNKPAEEMADYTRAIELPGAPADPVAKALFNRGVCHRQQNKPAEEMADYAKAIELPGAPADMVARALMARADQFQNSGDSPRAKADFETLVNLPEAPDHLKNEAKTKLSLFSKS